MGCPDLVVFGNLLTDDVVYEDGRTRMGEPGGAALYCALGAALWETRVGIVSRVGNDYPSSVQETLRARGIDLGGVRDIGQPGLRTWLLYEGGLRRVVHRLAGPTHADVSPTADDLPPHWRRCGLFHLAPMPFAVHEELVGRLSCGGDARVSLDPYELLTESRIDAWRRLLRGVDLLLFSEDEMEVAGGRENPLPTLRRISTADGRPEHILFKRGARGGLCYHPASEQSTLWSPRVGTTLDPTGAGDAFAGGLLAGLVSDAPMSTAIAMGIVSASFALEADGATGLLTADPSQARARLGV